MDSKLKYAVVRQSLRMLQRIPFGMWYLMAPPLRGLLRHVVRYRRKVVRRNLTESFPEKSEKEIKDLEKGFYRYFVDNFIETVKMGTMSDSEMKRRMRFKNIGDLDAVLASGKSIGLYLGHYGNWEWISSMPLHLKADAVAAQVYHKLSNPVADRLMLEERASHGATNVEMRQTARFITGRLKEGKVTITGFIADQSPKRREINHYVEYLNHTAPAMTGTEKIVKHYGMEAWFARPRRVKRGYYEVEFVKMHDDPRSLPDFALTDIYFRMLEEMIRENPECYLWSHNRFKFAKPHE